MENTTLSPVEACESPRLAAAEGKAEALALACRIVRKAAIAALKNEAVDLDVLVAAYRVIDESTDPSYSPELSMPR